VVLWARTSIALNSEVKKKGTWSAPTDVTWISTQSQFSDTHTPTLITSERRLGKAASHQPNTSHFSRCVKHHQSNKLQRSTASDNGVGAVSSCGAQQESTECVYHIKAPIELQRHLSWRVDHKLDVQEENATGCYIITNNNSVALVRERTIPTERSPLVREVSDNFCGYRGCRVVSSEDPYGRNLGFLDCSLYFFFQIAPQLYSRGWVDPVPDPPLRKTGSAENRTRISGSVVRKSDH
jgi:hypothetical protein